MQQPRQEEDMEENSDDLAEANADEGKATEANLSDAGSSDDAIISQPPTLFGSLFFCPEKIIGV